MFARGLKGSDDFYVVFLYNYTISYWFSIDCAITKKLKLLIAQ